MHTTIFTHPVAGFIFGGAILLSRVAVAQVDKPTVAAVSPVGSSSPAASSASPSENAAKVAALKQTVATAAGRVINRIQVEEKDLFWRLGYFEKPARLDPAGYASREEVSQWKVTLAELKTKAVKVAALYNDCSKDLDAELRHAKLEDDIVKQAKAQILEGFDWGVIRKKSSLMQQYVDEHGQLLDFYDKNWGTWKGKDSSGKPLFEDRALTTQYGKLRDQIQTTAKQLDQQYKLLSE